MADILWKDRKRTLFGLPWSFTRYSYSKEKLYIKTGFFNIKEEEVRLYRILDVTLNRKLGERIFGLGTIHCCSADKSTPEFDIRRIKNSEKVKEQLSDLIEAQRVEKRISGREFMSDHDDDEHDDGHDDIL
jgi:uncharacterized membrane protein YdbT with pleckstrin-like domain